MKVSPSKNYLASMESVAMTDIVLNLFIFFFISFSILYTFNPNRVEQLSVKLPHAESASEIKNDKYVNVTVTEKGLIYIGKESVPSKKELSQKISERLKENPDTVFIINSDEMAYFKEVVTVLDVFKELGVRKLNVATTREKRK